MQIVTRRAGAGRFVKLIAKFTSRKFVIMRIVAFDRLQGDGLTWSAQSP
jgi:hypothetical protein